MLGQNRIRIAFLLVLLAGATLLSFFVLKPFLSAIFLAIIAVITFDGFHERMVRFFRWNKTVWALFSTIIICLGILIPLVFFGALIFQEAQTLYSKIPASFSTTGFVDNTLSLVEARITTLFPSFSLEITQYARQALEWVVGNMSAFFAGFLGSIVTFFITMLGLFYLFKDGKSIMKSLTELSPLEDRYDIRIFNKIKSSVDSIVRGTLIKAVIQGLLVYMGFLFFGVPNPALWGAVAVIASLIPAIGTAVVTVPAIIYLFYVGEIVPMFFLIVWASLVIGLSDNILTPYLMKRGGLEVHPFIILISILGGVSFFGPVGFIAGPVVISVFYALMDVYPMIVQGIEKDKI